MGVMGGTNDMPDRLGLVRRGLWLARDVLTAVVTAVDEGSRRNAVLAVTADVARARERAEAVRALGVVAAGRSPAA